MSDGIRRGPSGPATRGGVGRTTGLVALTTVLCAIAVVPVWLLWNARVTVSDVAALAAAGGTLGAVAISALGSRVPSDSPPVRTRRTCDYRGSRRLTCIVLFVGLLTDRHPGTRLVASQHPQP